MNDALLDKLAQLNRVILEANACDPLELYRNDFGTLRRVERLATEALDAVSRLPASDATLGTLKILCPCHENPARATARLVAALRQKGYINSTN
jgi:hypothetical protein